MHQTLNCSRQTIGLDQIGLVHRGACKMATGRTIVRVAIFLALVIDVQPVFGLTATNRSGNFLRLHQDFSITDPPSSQLYNQSLRRCTVSCLQADCLTLDFKQDSKECRLFHVHADYLGKEEMLLSSIYAKQLN